jgi:pimeloyl-ACP methyl ester carboxylesterase
MRHAVAALLIALSGAAAAADRWLETPAPPPMPEPIKSGLAPVNGIEMYYAVFGEGPPVLLIHGGLAHADVWGAQVADLMADHTVIVADSRGHGRSSRTEEPYGYHLMASDYLALLDHLGIDKVDLVGWSDGGIIGLDIALSNPERLNRLFAHAANVTVDGVAPGVETNPVFGAYIERAGSDYARLSRTPDQFESFVEQIGAMWASQPTWTDAELATITTPVAVVLGDHDEAITREHTEHMAAVIPGAELVILPEVSHFALIQAPDEYNAAIRAFLK